MKKILALLLALALGSCSVWDFIKPSSGPSLSVEATAGDKKIHSEITGKEEVTNNTAESIVQTYNTVNKNTDYWMVLAAIIGWIMPSPRQVFLTVRNWWRTRKYGKKG